jgi:hypothetical protein
VIRTNLVYPHHPINQLIGRATSRPSIAALACILRIRSVRASILQIATFGLVNCDGVLPLSLSLSFRSVDFGSGVCRAYVFNTLHILDIVKVIGSKLNNQNASIKQPESNQKTTRKQPAAGQISTTYSAKSSTTYSTTYHTAKSILGTAGRIRIWQQYHKCFFRRARGTADSRKSNKDKLPGRMHKYIFHKLFHHLWHSKEH